MSGLPVVWDDAQVLIPDPETGELFVIEVAGDALLARASDALKVHGDEVRSARLTVNDELARRLKAAGLRSMAAGRFGVESSERREWDAAATWTALGDLVTAGLISAAEAEEAMPERTIRKPDGRKLNAILTRLVGEDPLAAQDLALARSATTSVKVTPTAVDGSVAEAGA